MKQENWNKENKGKPWTDNELKVVLSDAPTKNNCIKYAKAFKRGYGGVAQIYQWAATKKKEIKRKRPDDKFVNQIKNISKKLDWVV